MITTGQVNNPVYPSHGLPGATSEGRALDSAQLSSASSTQSVEPIGHESGSIAPVKELVSSNKEHADSAFLGAGKSDQQRLGAVNHGAIQYDGMNANNRVQQTTSEGSSGGNARSISSNSAQVNGEPSSGPTTVETLSQDELKVINQLKMRDTEVRAHEAAHAAVGGSLASAPTFDFVQGPDGKRYAVGGEVQIDTSKGRSPEETLEKARVIQAAANAPLNPSAQDRMVASQAALMAQEARAELLEESSQQANPLTSEEGDNEATEDQVKAPAEEKEAFILPIFDENHQTAADIFEEIYGREDMIGQTTTETGAAKEEELPLANIDLIA